ncbi:pleckstrin homology domain-containing family F member 2-like [Epinephelus fuscoguttatus]|uniref:pleckstrin homology domain-containing family F member 2-like n=1 Tax=Epinephelus fuscoguttatus TaxID=293821 RepID=UPI0020D0F2A2|nr:pleckstrin homology domain-containing family F member 2-like [Epinephelus fuscoguttatus]
MMDLLTFERENRQRIQAVENSFGPAGGSLSKPGRVLMGQGHLMKQGRRKPQPKSFFLFNDILVYGSIILNGRWHKNQKVIPLEGIQLEDVEDGDGMKNQWLIRTPRKSFYVSAPSFEEKRAWIDHIEECRSNLLQGGSSQPRSTFAVAWIPDPVAFKCMRCFNKFTATKRRHHCRKCGFLVCNSCSKERAVIDHIHPTKRLRVCSFCHTRNKEDEMSRVRGDSTGKNSSEEDIEAASSDEEDTGEMSQTYTSSSWLDSQMGTWGHVGTYVYPRPMNQRPLSHHSLPDVDYPTIMKE